MPLAAVSAWTGTSNLLATPLSVSPHFSVYVLAPAPARPARVRNARTGRRDFSFGGRGRVTRGLPSPPAVTVPGSQESQQPLLLHRQATPLAFGRDLGRMW